MADLLGQSRSFGLLAAATPGLRELLSMGKVWELAQDERRTPGARSYDLVVLDAPATGHGVAALAAPSTLARAARTGPVARQGRVIAQWVADPARTAVVAVARPEELPVAETVALAGELRARLGMELEGVVVNAMAPERFSPAQEAQLRQALPGLDGGVSGWALRRALAHADVTRAQRALAQRLAREVGLPPLLLPIAVDPQRGSADLDALAAALELAGHP
ncbi:MAG TPA: ArsA-related P-loop ATPase, partial [Solirubrobacteraceae bacterium]|nr:ArsA-related P-loop ATPase [Solirubrobacteraceae bacterium]